MASFVVTSRPFSPLSVVARLAPGGEPVTAGPIRPVPSKGQATTPQARLAAPRPETVTQESP